MPGSENNSENSGRCEHDGQRKGSVYNPFAVCTSSANEECEKEIPPYYGIFGKQSKAKETAVSSGFSQLTRSGVNQLELKDG